MLLNSQQPRLFNDTKSESCAKIKSKSCLFQNDDEEDEEEEGDDAEELLGKGARSAALLADRTRVSVACVSVCRLPLVITLTVPP